MISIIVPVYNVEIYLESCIMSILSQTFKDFEIILVNDGSQDSSGFICDEYCKHDIRIKVIHQENAGLSAARNIGIEASKGEWLCFVDSDDMLQPNTLEILHDLCKADNADLSVCSYLYCDHETAYKDIITHREIDDIKAVFVEKDKMEAYIKTKVIPTMAWGKLYRRQLFSEIKFPVGKQNEDVFVMPYIIHKANKVVFTDYPGYIYRKNSESIMNRGFNYGKLDSIEASLQRANFICIKYPDLRCAANAGIISSCNYVIRSLAKSDNNDVKLRGQLKSIYREYYQDYLMSNSSVKGKIFVIVACISIRAAIFILKKYL